MELTIFAGRSNPALANAVADRLGVGLGQCTIESFPDDEIRVEVAANLQNQDVYIIQSTNPPVTDHIFEILLIADAGRRAGAARITAVIPYFGYARQDRRKFAGEPIAARLVADMLATRLDRIVAVDLHNPAIEGYFTLPTEHLSAVPILAKALLPLIGDSSVVVAPDLGAAKLAEHYADRLKLPVAYIHKERSSDREVSVRRIIGDVKGRMPIVVDDMISTGGTLISAMEALLERGCQPSFILAATHALLVDQAVERLSEMPVKQLLTTDSVRGSKFPALPIRRVHLGSLLGESIQRLHRTGS